MSPEVCYNTLKEADVYKGPTIGYCHICRELDPIEFCGWCGHWVCLGCKGKFWHRGKAFVHEMLKGPSLDCCGPLAKVA